MSDESATTSTIAPGWFADPEVAGQRRYWDGGAWTEHVAVGDDIDLREQRVVSAVARPPSAPVGKRLAGRFIDRSILSLGGPLVVFASIAGDLGDVYSAITAGFWILTTIFGLVALDTVFIAKLGGTPGKLLMGLQVVDAATDRPVGLGQAFGRSALGVFAGLSFSGGLVGPALLGPIFALIWLLIGAISLIMLLVGKSRTVHDRLGSTRVVERSALTVG